MYILSRKNCWIQYCISTIIINKQFFLKKDIIITSNLKNRVRNFNDRMKSVAEPKNHRKSLGGCEHIKNLFSLSDRNRFFRKNFNNISSCNRETTSVTVNKSIFLLYWNCRLMMVLLS